MSPPFKRIVSEFQFDGEFQSARIYGTGHIHDTYEALFRSDEDTRRYIMQRINQSVFRDPEGVMSNIQAVTAHLRRKIVVAGGDPHRENSEPYTHQ